MGSFSFRTNKYKLLANHMNSGYIVSEKDKLDGITNVEQIKSLLEHNIDTRFVNGQLMDNDVWLWLWWTREKANANATKQNVNGDPTK